MFCLYLGVGEEEHRAEKGLEWATSLFFSNRSAVFAAAGSPEGTALNSVQGCSGFFLRETSAPASARVGLAVF